MLHMASFMHLGRRATVSLLFATALVPLLMLVGLAIDFGFYTEAQEQLNMAADASAMHAVRVAIQLLQNGASQSAALAGGQEAGTQWFAAQLGNVPKAQAAFNPSCSPTGPIAGGVDSYCVTMPPITANQVTAQVNYSGVITTNFGRLFPDSWAAWPNWGITGAATAVISTQTYNQFNFLIDDSSSMTIAATTAGITRMEQLTPCSTQALQVQAVSAQPLMDPFPGTYSWFYDANGNLDNNSPYFAPGGKPGTKIPYGYGIFQYNSPSNKTLYTNEIVPPPSSSGECDPRFSTNAVPGGYESECFYVPARVPDPPNQISLIPPLTSAGYCTNNGGGTDTQLNAQGTGTITVQNVPQAPCAFACHTAAPTIAGDDATSPDYYGLARANNIQLRFDVIQQALVGVGGGGNALQQAVFPTLETYARKEGNVNSFTVGVYYFDAAVSNPVPPVVPSGTQTSLSLLQAAQSAVEKIQTPITQDFADTNVPLALQTLLSYYQTSGNVGNGSLPTAPKQNLFIVTDGMQDYVATLPAGAACASTPTETETPVGTQCRIQGAVDPTLCDQIKALGVTIYVVYTPYNPLPNPYYLNNDQRLAEPISNSLISQGLQACATPSTATNTYYLGAQNQAQISAALNTFLLEALDPAGRLTN